MDRNFRLPGKLTFEVKVLFRVWRHAVDQIQVLEILYAEELPEEVVLDRIQLIHYHVVFEYFVSVDAGAFGAVKSSVKHSDRLLGCGHGFVWLILWNFS